MSQNVVTQNIAQLRELFPEAWTEDKLDFEVLKQLLGCVVEDREEKFGLNWHGKRRARQLALIPSTGTLRPCPDESVDWDSTQNLMIEGDNLEVLKLLQKSYARTVKLIYIDPPYNTGKDFVYPDDFHDSIKNYLMLTGQVNTDGRKLSTNTDTGGRFHTEWLNMFFPRLKVARNLLRDDGIMIIHIDENEYRNLESMLEEIFGSENNLGTIVWDKRNPKGEVLGVAQQHELISVFCKNREAFSSTGYFKRRKENAERMLKKVSDLIRQKGKMCEEVRVAFRNWLKEKRADLSGGEAAYCLIDDDGEIYRPVSMAAPDKPETRSHRPLQHPRTNRPCPVPGKGWRFPDASMDELLSKGQILFGPDENTQPQRKYLLRENVWENVPSLLYYGGSDDAEGLPFDNPKPVFVATKLVESTCRNSDIVMDFFAGSGTVGHAVMTQNAVDNECRRFVLVQLPEPISPENKWQKEATDVCDSLGVPRSLVELTKERLRRAAKKVKNESPLFSGDLGFRVFKLDSSNINAWDPDRENLDQALLNSMEHIKPDRSDDDVLYELLLKLGLDLCVPIEQRTIAKRVVHSIGAGALIVCLATKISRDDAEPLALGIVEWHKQQNPAGDTTIVFRDSAFGDDVTKTNVTAILQQHGLENVRSL